MSEYIERKQTIDRFEDLKEKADSLKDKAYLDAVIAVLENIPSADVEPVVHAKWKIEYDELGWLRHTCTNCGYMKRTDVHVSLDWKRCLNCGAKMDLED